MSEHDADQGRGQGQGQRADQAPALAPGPVGDVGPSPQSEAQSEAQSGGADEPHDDTGLDLARLIAKSLAGAPGLAAARPRPTANRRRRPGRMRSSGAHPDDRDPQRLDVTVGRLVDDLGWQTDLSVHGVFGRWPELVGAEVAEHSTPESFDSGRLVVRTDSTAWATQLTLLAPTLVRRLNEELGDGTVTFIDVQGPLAPSWKKGRLSTRGRGPRDTYG